MISEEKKAGNCSDVERKKGRDWREAGWLPLTIWTGKIGEVGIGAARG